MRPCSLPASQPLISRDRILQFALGRPSLAFGEPYEIFDNQRRIARLPAPPYSFLDRIVRCEPPQWVLKPGGWVTAEYDVPPDAWYFAAERGPSMPFCVLLEIALQPCGWLAAWCGSALRSTTDLRFRNLGGTATQHAEVFADAGTLTTEVRLTGVSEAGGMIIEKFDFRVSCDGRSVYTGDTSFGFFSASALADQVGLRDAKPWRPADAQTAAAFSFDLPNWPPFSPAEAGGEDTLELHGRINGRVRCADQTPSAQPDKPQVPGPEPLSGPQPTACGLFPARALRMIDRIDAFLPDAGPHGLGWLRASADVEPAAWFFQAHFHQDPVWPGSLGLESFIQLLKFYALRRWGDALQGPRRFQPLLGREHVWAYRGQIIPSNRRVTVEATITRLEEGDEPQVLAEGLLSVDGKPIYQMKDFGVRLSR